MASVFTVLTKLQADVSNFSAGMAKAQASLDKLEKAVAKTGGNMDKNLTKESKKAAGGLGKLKGAFGAAAAAGAAFAAVNYVKGAVGAASAYEAEFVGVEQTFGSASQVVKDFADQAAYTAGLSETAALRYAKSFGGFATSAGLAGDAQAKFATSLVQTAGDLGSFFDLPTEQALAAIQAGIRGEFEPLRRFNILLDETAIKTAAMNQGIYNGTGDLTAQQKVLGAQAAILSQVGVAQNDFTKYADTYGNSIKTVDALMQNLAADLGTALLPSMAKLAQAFIPIVESLAPLLEKVFKAIIPVIEAFTKSLAPVVDALAPLIDAFVPVMELIASLVETILPPFVEILGLITPIVRDILKALEPLAEQGLTVLGDILDSFVMPLLRHFADIISTFVVPAIEFLADIIGTYINPVVSGLAELIQTYVTPQFDAFHSQMGTILPDVQKFFEDAFNNIGKVIEWTYNNIIKPVFGGILDFMRDVLGIDIATTIADIGSAFQKGYDRARNQYNNSKLSFTGEEARMKAIQEAKEVGTAAGNAAGTAMGNAMKPPAGKGGKDARNAWRELFLGFTEDVKKQEAKIRLATLGLSAALIDKVLGDTDWEKIYNRIIKGGAKTAQNLQNAFNKTTDGIEEMAEATELAAQKLKEFNDAADAFKLSVSGMMADVNPFKALLDKRGEYERQVGDMFDNFYDKIREGLTSKLFSEDAAKGLRSIVDDYNKQLSDVAKSFDSVTASLENLKAVREATTAFREGIQGLTSATLPLARVEREIGRFEQQVISSFDEIDARISEGINIGLLSEAIGQQLRASANATRATLNRIARQRDDLAKTYNEFIERLNTTTEFRKATREAVMGYANITSLGKSARTIVKNFGVIVQRTETFRQQLSTLNQMGLNRELYNQILQSGLDAGSATAKALLKGGPKAVTELNALYARLNLTADTMAAETTNVMFEGGEAVIQGFIDGVIAQDEKLMAEAQAVASAFNAAFTSSIDLATVNLDGLIAQLEAQRDALIQKGTSLAQAFNDAFSASLKVAIAEAAPPAVAPAPAPAEPEPAPQTAAGRSRKQIWADIEAIREKIFNAEKYIANMQKAGKMTQVAGATTKLNGYIAQREKLIDEYNAAKMLAGGGMIRGAGTATSDSIPARLSNGEFVMSASAVDKFGAGFMSAINSGRVPAFATGGAVGSARIVTGGGGKTVINNKYEINVRTGIGDPAAIGKQVVSAIAAYQKTSGRQIL